MNQTNTRTSAKDLLNYGLLGWALGAVAVPIYIQVPYLYSRIYEVPSAWVGIILLLSRLLDALLDPAIGLWVDRRSGQGNRYALPLLLAVPLLLLGMAGVFFPLGNNPVEYAASLMGSLIVVHLGYSFASIAYQAWGAELGHTDKERSTFVAVREGVGILGVVFAVSLALETNAGLIFTVFAIMLIVGMFLLLKFSPQPDQAARNAAQKTAQQPASALAQTFNNTQISAAKAIRKGFSDIVQPMRRRNFRKLMGVFLCNGLAAALPATLVPFYMRDRLGLGDADQWVLAVYFLMGAASTIFWVWLASKIGLARAWLLGMVISIPAFVVVIALGQGDLAGYLLVCVLTGFALGADLSLPAALVARLIEENGERGKTEGTYFGLWNWVNKFNLALAPSFALGTLQWFNYSADMATTDAYQNMGLLQQIASDPLIWVYALVPCALKLLAIVLLGRSGLASLNTTTPNTAIGSTA
ncbi:MAG: MFS transporter [Gammaproteobacteria bacterium]|nr:MFS transporter [Gammaproteobacteria bacterium]MBU0847886.1 MFS transporter [Gammaproteobacteria bacterium]MBU1268994.1 MFS transporter [Gammaproteobacteria bacterium]MBU1529672.1 MFS transporter [Gammaproteobacteria bacterium]MBU1780077.1 MFS transporter [Gammaproteobacteria bacterium]